MKEYSNKSKRLITIWNFPPNYKVSQEISRHLYIVFLFPCCGGVKSTFDSFPHLKKIISIRQMDGKFNQNYMIHGTV